MSDQNNNNEDIVKVNSNSIEMGFPRTTVTRSYFEYTAVKKPNPNTTVDLSKGDVTLLEDESHPSFSQDYNSFSKIVAKFKPNTQSQETQFQLKQMLEHSDYKKLVSITSRLMNEYESPSHDFKHILRVVRNCFEIGMPNPSTESVINWRVLIFSAFLHDAKDHKFNNQFDLENTLKMDFTILSPQEIEKILLITGNVSWSVEKSWTQSKRALLETNWELCIVQDADRVDALGEIGLFRVLTCTAEMAFKTNKKKFDVDNVINHCKDKLLILKNFAKTVHGKKLMEEKTQCIQNFVNDLE